eukprot:765563-Hanusia_phi.AAC.1
MVSRSMSCFDVAASCGWPAQARVYSTQGTGEPAGGRTQRVTAWCHRPTRYASFCTRRLQRLQDACRKSGAATLRQKYGWALAAFDEDQFGYAQDWAKASALQTAAPCRSCLAMPRLTLTALCPAHIRLVLGPVARVRCGDGRQHATLGAGACGDNSFHGHDTPARGDTAG